MAKRVYTEEELVKGCRQNLPAAQEAFYQTYSRTMMGVCLRYSTDRMEAEDLLHHGFMKALTHLDGFKGGSLEGWLRRIFVREAINQFHKNQRQKLDYAENLPEADSNAEDAMSRLSADEILEMIADLPQGCRIIFNLYAIEGYTHPEIGKELGISEGTSKSQLARARMLLKAKITATQTHR